MRKDRTPLPGDKYLAEKRRRQLWKKVMAALGCFVALGTVSALTLPAITMNKPLVCELEEHRHDDSCYQAVEVNSDEYHTHTPDCYEWVKGDTLVCGLEETGEIISENGAASQTLGGTSDGSGMEIYIGEPQEELIIEPEAEGGIPQAGSADSPGQSSSLSGTQIPHHHSDDCYIWQQGNLICGKKDASQIERTLTCTLPEVELHTHNEECWKDGVLICSKPETPGHQHTENCFEAKGGELVCTLAEHIHDTSCCMETETETESESEVNTETTVPAAETEETFIQSPESGTETEVTSSENESEVSTEPEETDTEKTEFSTETMESEPGETDTETSTEETGSETETAESGTEGTESETEPGESGTEGTESETEPGESETEGTETEEFSTEAEEGLTEETSDAEMALGEEFALTEEEQAQVEELEAKIEALPAVEDVREQLHQAELLGDAEGRRQIVDDLAGQIQEIRTAYESFTELQQILTGGMDKVIALEELLAAEMTNLTEEEQKQVDEVITLIEALPPLEEAEAVLEQLGAGGALEELALYKEELVSAVTEAEERYRALSEAQRAAVTNAAKLEAYLAWMGEEGFLKENLHLVKQYTDATYTQLLESPVSILVEGELPEGAEIRSYPVEVSMNDIDTLCAYDITIFLQDGSIYQPEIPVTVHFSGLTPNAGADLAVYHIEENDRPEMIPSESGKTAVSFTAEHFSVYAVTDIQALQSIAEPGDPAAVQALAESGFFSYWSSAAAEAELAQISDSGKVRAMAASTEAPPAAESMPSDKQITNPGNSKTDGTVTVSKTIKGTNVENVFDITLAVDTTTNITELLQEPDMAVVIVMDISNTMTDSFGSSTRYEAAIVAAEQFLNSFTAANKGYSKIGYVAFNTDAHEIFGLSSCSTTAEATALKNIMRTKTGEIITVPNYRDLHSRFTNVDAGLKRANDMLADATNKNKYIIFLSDGFPTTYISEGYKGWDPYMDESGTWIGNGIPGTDGYFHDSVNNGECWYGTSYSDKAAIRAREMATSVKDSGTTIFSIGIDVGGQTITKYDTHRNDKWSVIDRTSESYEIGSAEDADAFKQWLGNSIGSGYYYDSTDTNDLKAAYDTIFQEIKSTTEQANNLKWIASDPMPTTQNGEVTMEFIGFYNKEQVLQVYPPQDSLTGSNKENGENTVSFNGEKSAISWDIKNSGFTTTGSGNSTTYHYTVTYRVRLKNELEGFIENQSYITNGKTTLTYQEVTVVDDKETISGDKTIDFPIPTVKGYLGELKFRKVTGDGAALAGAEFALAHDVGSDGKCPDCRGDRKSHVDLGLPVVRISGEDGTVSFEKIPSGHIYTLKETKIPEGYYSNGSTYSVEVDYDVVTVTETKKDGSTTTWDLSNSGSPPEFVNESGVLLPATGGSGTLWYMISGLALMGAAALIYKSKWKQAKGGEVN